MISLDTFQQQLTQRIAESSRSQVPVIGDITSHLLYSGKRVRSRFTWLTGSLFEVENQDHLLDLACAIEFIHLATLMHDDVVDQSLLRRGQAAVHARWSASHAVLVGDFVYSRAFELLVNIGNSKILELTSRATNQLAEGEVEQLEFSKAAEYSHNEYFRVIEKKTGALFGCAFACAATLAEIDDETSEQLYQLGIDIGVAFQVIDDLLDYSATSDAMGKNSGDDFREGKYTLPLILTIEHADAGQLRLIEKCLAIKDDDSFKQIKSLMNRLDIFEKTKQAAKRKLQPVQELVLEMPEGNAKQLILEEINRLLDRAA